MKKAWDLNRVGEMKGIQHGMTVHDSRIRIVPTLRPEHVAIENSGRARWDMFNLDIVPIASPVQNLTHFKRWCVHVRSNRKRLWLDQF